jgi:hypothetical protein
LLAGDFEDMLALRIDAMRLSLERVGRFDLARSRESACPQDFCRNTCNTSCWMGSAWVFSRSSLKARQLCGSIIFTCAARPAARA